jgi:hypothetical protein
MSQRVQPRNHCSEGGDKFADQFLRPSGDLAETNQALVGAHLYQHDLIALHTFMRGPAWLSVWDRHGMGANLSDLHHVRFLRGVGLAFGISRNLGGQAKDIPDRLTACRWQRKFPNVRRLNVTATGGIERHVGREPDCRLNQHLTELGMVVQRVPKLNLLALADFVGEWGER